MSRQISGMRVLGSQRASIENKGFFCLKVRKFAKRAVFVRDLFAFLSIQAAYGVACAYTSSKPSRIIHPSSPQIVKNADRRRFSYYASLSEII